MFIILHSTQKFRPAGSESSPNSGSKKINKLQIDLLGMECGPRTTYEPIKRRNKRQEAFFEEGLELVTSEKQPKNPTVSRLVLTFAAGGELVFFLIRRLIQTKTNAGSRKQDEHSGFIAPGSLVFRFLL